VTRLREGDRVAVRFRDSGPGARPAIGTVSYVCVAMRGLFVLLEDDAPPEAFGRVRFNGGPRLVLAYHDECAPLPVVVGV
jgi:hypothetical protein